MAYVSTAQLAARLGQTLYARLTDRTSGTTADAAVAQQIVDEASAVVDSYLARRYATPIDLTAHPELSDVMTARVLDLAEYLAWAGSPFVTDPPERVRLVHEHALKWLEAVADGLVVLPAAAPPSSPNAANDNPRYSATPRKFTADELDGL